jgi:RHS repeat-associated protein
LVKKNQQPFVNKPVVCISQKQWLLCNQFNLQTATRKSLTFCRVLETRGIANDNQRAANDNPSPSFPRRRESRFFFLGRVTNKTVNTVGTVALSVGYSYDGVGHLASMTYPSGKVVSYGYDTNGRVQSVSLNGTSLISNINYQPFGAPKSWVWSNGTAYSRSFDADGRLSAYALSPTRQRSVLFDAGNRVTGYNDTVASRSQSFSYDANDRMIGWSNSTVAEAFSYDANSNRLSYATTGKTLAQTTYPTTNNRFIAVTGGAANLTPTYDATGNITYMYNVTYNYDARNRMASSVNGGITTNYWINGLGQRARKTYNAATPSSLTFVYDEARRHIGTYNLAGVPSEETIYLGDTPIAVLMGTDINYNYVYADQTNTPRVITNTAGQQRWAWDNTAPFGQAVPNLNPAGFGDFVYRHGMPGQVYDAESGAYNNGFRDYYPLIGRYLQSDPIGLAGGDFSTYGYVGGNPVMGSDVSGLAGLIPFPVKIMPLPISPPLVTIPGTPEHDEYMKWANKMGDNFYQNFSDMMSTLKDWSKRNCPMLNSSAIDKEQEKVKRCEDNLDRDLEYCSALGWRDGKSAFKICEGQAMLRYSNCLSGRDEGIDAPLPPAGTK